MGLTISIINISGEDAAMSNTNHPFWVIVNKEISDYVRSWRFIILIAIIALTCMGSLYTALTNIREAIKPNDPDGAFLFLKLFTVSDGTLPSFAVFISFLGPLLGISLGFDAINSEQNKGTLSRILSQPIHRDYLINAKFVAALAVIGIMLFMLGFLVMGFGLIAIGIPPTAEEFMRVVFFLFVSLFYVAFWLNLSIFFSIRFKQAATSALACVAIWLFFSVFYNMIINLVGKALSPSLIRMARIKDHDPFVRQYQKRRIIMVIRLKIRADQHLILPLLFKVILHSFNIAMYINITDICPVYRTFFIFIMQSPRIGKPAPGSFGSYFMPLCRP